MFSVALHGHLTAQFGLAGGAAATARLLEAVGCELISRDLLLPTHPSVLQAPAAATSGGAPQLDLVHTNPNLLAANPELLQPSTLQAPLRIGYWAWELEAFPEGWEPYFGDYDEIWCRSGFQRAGSGSSRDITRSGAPAALPPRPSPSAARCR